MGQTQISTFATIVSTMTITPATPTLHKGYLPGAIGRIVELHGRYYGELAGFGLPFESRVARELCEFCERYEEGRDGLWLAVLDGGIEGAIAIDGSRAGQEGAHLRWFIVADSLRGTGVGNALLTSAMEFCRARHYERVYLWTFEGLGAARHLYEKFGFRLVLQQSGTQWGVEVNEQRFESGPGSAGRGAAG
jgi:GNAT superfamily N-acetyltransferase